jgi:hypothetical protein
MKPLKLNTASPPVEGEPARILEAQLAEPVDRARQKEQARLARKRLSELGYP